MRISERPLLTAAQIRRRVAELAEHISRDYQGHEITVVTVLKGGAIFAADLIRQITVAVTLDFIRAKSYEGTLSRGVVEVMVFPEVSLAGKQVLLVEDILDTGRTASAILERLKVENPATMKVCALLDKPTRRVTPVPLDYRGFSIDDRFVVGYGLDYEERYRELPAIYLVEDS